MPSCMRAPPEQESIINEVLFLIALSIDLVIFSPATTPMLPPMKLNSKKQISTGWFLMCPDPEITASEVIPFL